MKMIVFLTILLFVHVAAFGDVVLYDAAGRQDVPCEMAVTGGFDGKLAKKNGVELMDCYTGFKWIANEIRVNEGKKKYIGGGEESFGFLPFDKVRDKDSPASICLICEIASWARDNGMTLYDLLMNIYKEYGYDVESLEEKIEELLK